MSITTEKIQCNLVCSVFGQRIDPRCGVLQTELDCKEQQQIVDPRPDPSGMYYSDVIYYFYKNL